MENRRIRTAIISDPVMGLLPVNIPRAERVIKIPVIYASTGLIAISAGQADGLPTMKSFEIKQTTPSAINPIENIRRPFWINLCMNFDLAMKFCPKPL